MSDSGLNTVKTEDNIDEGDGVSRTESRPLTLCRKRPLFRPPEFVKRLTGEETTREGEAAKFICKITGFPRPILSWYKDDDVLSPDGTRVKIIEENDGSCCIEITSLLRSDEAAYRCRAENTEGSSSSCWYMAVKSKGDKKSRRRSRSCSPRRGVSYPPLFPTILEKVDEEEKEEEETKEQPVSPLTELYDGVKDKRKEWFKFVGEWAFADGEEEKQASDPEESDDTEEEKIKREEENNEKNLSLTDLGGNDGEEPFLTNDDRNGTGPVLVQNTKISKDNRNSSPEVKDAKNRISRSEKRAACQGNLKQIASDKDQTKVQSADNSSKDCNSSEQCAPSSLVEPESNDTSLKQDHPQHSFPLTRDLPEDGPSIFRPKSTDRPIQAPCLISRAPAQNIKQGTLDTPTKPGKSSSESGDELVSGSVKHVLEDSLRENLSRPITCNQDSGHAIAVKDTCSLPNEENSEELNDSTSSTAKGDIKGTSKCKFSPKQKSKLAARRKRRRSIKSQKGQGFLPSAEEIFLYLTALTFFCIFFNISPVPFILLILWGEISTCIFYSLYYGNEDDSKS